jgi:hypothetical protein
METASRFCPMRVEISLELGAIVLEGEGLLAGMVSRSASIASITGA